MTLRLHLGVIEPFVLIPDISWREKEKNSQNYSILFLDPKEANVLLSSFSAYKNCRKLLKLEDNPKAIHCLDGIRTLATFWILIGHVFVIFNFLIANQIDAMEVSYLSIFYYSENWVLKIIVCIEYWMVVHNAAVENSFELKFSQSSNITKTEK